MALVKSNWLDAATTLQTTAPEEVSGATQYSLQLTTTGAPTTVFVDLEGSLDGVTWFALITTNSAPVLKSLTGLPVKFIRLLLAGLSGGTNPTVSASVIAI